MLGWPKKSPFISISFSVRIYTASQNSYRSDIDRAIRVA